MDESFHEGNNLRTWGIYSIGAVMIGMGLVLALSAARFSFLLSAPIIFGAGVKKAYDLLKDPATANPLHISAVAVAGFVAAAVAGYLVIHFLLGYLQKQDTMVFVYYRIVVGVAIILLAVSGLR